MQEYARKNIRNIVVLGHGQVGKTSLLDACLFKTGAVSRVGRVDEGTSVYDTEPEETARRFSITSKLAAMEWQDCKLNFLDTPGYPDFLSEVRGAMLAADNALIVISAPDGIQVETEKVWRLAEQQQMPRAIFLNKMDREHADFKSVVDELRVRFGKGVVPVQMPIGEGRTFQGTLDLLSLSGRIMAHDAEHLDTAVPEFMEEAVSEARQALVEALADFDDTLLEKFLNGEDIPEEDIGKALTEGVAAGKVFPLFCGSSAMVLGIRKFMNGMVAYMPEPQNVKIGTDQKTGDIVERRADEAFSAQVYKTVMEPTGRVSYLRVWSGEAAGDMSAANPARSVVERFGGFFTTIAGRKEKLSKAIAGDIVATTKLSDTCTGDTLCDKEALIRYEAPDYPLSMLIMAAHAAKKEDEEKVVAAMEKEQISDQTLTVERNQETKEVLVRALGEVQLDILKERIKRKTKLDVIFSAPAIPLRETIRKKSTAEGKHKKQSGGHGQYGHVFLELTPLAPGSGNTFTDAIVGGAVPKTFIPAVEKGAMETLAQGVIAGYPVVDVNVKLTDGSYHTVDSSEASFKTAAAIAIKKAVQEGDPVLLEPIFNVRISAPEYFMGDVMGQLNARRAKIMGMENDGRDMSEIKAQIPALELFRYATDLRAQTRGRGSFSVEFSHYEEMPQKEAEKYIKKKDEK